MEDLKITLVQTQLHWENVEKNLSMFDEILNSIGQTDLIILPEMFSTGFTMNTAVAEKMDGKSIVWLKEKAKEKNSVITGSLMITENARLPDGQKKNYNRLIWMQPDGNFETYDKRHLFRMANEQNHFTAGEKKLIATLKGWKICPLICYDLRFPIWSRNKSIVHSPQSIEFDYDVLIYVANWPERRRLAWNTLLPARGVENQSYVVGLNRIGPDGYNVDYSGDSVVYNPLGEKLSGIKPNENRNETITLSWKFLQEYREKFPAAMDADNFEIK